ncbi:MAG: CcmD family protein [Bacteroidetes bacterium]|nr:CcmD family protein [Bacteroidota bacterium]
MKKLLIFLCLTLSGFAVFAQNTDGVEMADKMRSSGMIYVVIATISIIFVGLAIYLFAMDRRLKKIEKEK